VSDRASTPVPAPRSFAALRHRGYRAFLAGNVLAMMADNIEHVSSYWVMFQKFQSPALGGFAVISHWLPFLLFSVPVGALADRVDPRRLIQCGMALFIIASLGWGWFFATDTLQMWHAMVLLVVHGCAGVLWQTASQVLIHDIVPRDELPSAVRLNATGRYLGVLVGPAVGGALLLGLGPADGMWVNTLFYLPLVLWLWRAPYGRAAQGSSAAPPRPVRGLADIAQTARDIAGHPVLVPMILLAGAASFFVGNSYQAQMPAFAHDLGHGRADASYSALLAADAAGALVAGFLLESAGWLRPRARTALLLAMLWCAALGSFALVTSFAAALALLFVAGFFELAFGSMAQTLVQLEAPKPILGRVLGLFNMAALGMRAFSGVMVGLSGSVLGVQAALAAAASAMLLFAALLLWRASAGRGEAPVSSDRG
jgi:MFS family permease